MPDFLPPVKRFYEIASKEAREPNALVKAFRTLEVFFYNLVAQLVGYMHTNLPGCPLTQ